MVSQTVRPGDARVVEAAQAELIANDGGLEMSGVARRAGLLVERVYHHFVSKM